MRRILVATANAGKLSEIRQILAGAPIVLISLAERFDPVPSIPETGETFEENARQKARWVSDRVPGMWVLADDSGLEVDALDGAPGVLSARYAGQGSSDRANLDKLLAALDGVPMERRTARFRCVALLLADGRELIGRGSCEGRIATIPAGTGGFGYDPVFIPEGHRLSFSQLDAAAKHALSHRGKACTALMHLLEAHDERPA